MRKVLVIVGGAAGATLLGRRLAHACGGCNFEQLIERMPDDAPPKWMFRNVSAIRANTERILELLSSKQAPETAARERAVA